MTEKPYNPQKTTAAKNSGRQPLQSTENYGGKGQWPATPAIHRKLRRQRTVAGNPCNPQQTTAAKDSGRQPLQSTENYGGKGQWPATPAIHRKLRRQRT